ncbi:MAG TPA: PspC domain-containing protein [Bacteroidota bacterium]|nr:PspC domain-containing protein [Bacteroidota bacterium]
MKRLFLSDSDKKIAGVCGGLAEYMGTDSTIVRLVVVALSIFTAIVPAVFVYVLAWMIIPRKPAS